MIPGVGSTGDSVYGHHLDFLNERVESTIDAVSRMLMELGQDEEFITNTSIEGLYFCASFADALENGPDENGSFVNMLREADANPPGLRERVTFEDMRGRIAGALPHKAIEERKPTSQTAEASRERTRIIRDSHYETWVLTNQDKVKDLLKISDQDEKIRKLQDMISRQEEIIEQLKKQLEMLSNVGTATPPGQHEKVVENEGNSDTIRISVKKYWGIGTVENSDDVDIETSLIYPADFTAVPAEIYMEDEKTGRLVSSVRYEVDLKNKEAFDDLFTRIRFLVIEFLEKGSVSTEIHIGKPSETSKWKPKMTGGVLQRMASLPETRHWHEYGVLKIYLGQSFFRVFVHVKKDGLRDFMEDISELLEMILQSTDR